MAEFDAYESTYGEEMKKALPGRGPTHDFYLQVKADLLLELARTVGRTPAEETSVLDVGCGTGSMCNMIRHQVGSCAGVDMSQGLIHTAADTVPGVTFSVSDGVRLPYADHSFDLVYTVCVLHHVPPSQWDAFIQEMFRVTQPGGLVVVMEHNPRNPLTLHIVNSCSFDKDAVLVRAAKLVPLMKEKNNPWIKKRYILFFPFRGNLFRWLDRFLGYIPFGGQYYVAGRKLT